MTPNLAPNLKFDTEHANTSGTNYRTVTAMVKHAPPPQREIAKTKNASELYHRYESRDCTMRREQPQPSLNQILTSLLFHIPRDRLYHSTEFIGFIFM